MGGEALSVTRARPLGSGCELLTSNCQLVELVSQADEWAGFLPKRYLHAI